MKFPRILSLFACLFVLFFVHCQDGCFQMDTTNNLLPSLGGATVFGDVDGDGDQDVIINGFLNGALTASLFLNDGMGEFVQQAGNSLQGATYGSVILEDLDGDLDKDLIIVGTDPTIGGVALYYYLNDGNGNFTLNPMAPADWSYLRLADISAADVDNDGDLDLLVSGFDVNNIAETSIYQNDGLGVFTQVTASSFIGVVLASCQFGDVNADGAVDLLISGKFANLNGVDTTALYLNDGSGGFSQILNTPFVGLAFPGLAFSDIDNDGDLDIAICGTAVSGQLIRIYSNDGLGNYTEKMNAVSESFESRVMKFSDMDADGYEDLVVIGHGDVASRFYRNDGTGVFVQESGPFMNSANSVSSCFVDVSFGSFDIADVDGDLDLDVLIVGDAYDGNSSNIIAALYLNNSEKKWYLDADTDGYGNPLIDSLACYQPTGFVADSLDCDDSSFGQGLSTWYADSDGDGFGDLATDSLACYQPTGFVADSLDCDDSNFGQGLSTWYVDADGDGFGDPYQNDTLLCGFLVGYSPTNDDCDDSNPSLNPGTVPATIWYLDGDNDGFGNALIDSSACFQPIGYVSDNTDCDDADLNIGALQTWYLDGDSDGIGAPFVTQLACTQPLGFSADSTDCNDFDPNVYPGASCNDGDPNSSNDVIDASCNCVGDFPKLAVTVFLEGPYDATSGLMRDDLRALNLIPLTEPYTALGYGFDNFQQTPIIAGSGSTIDAAILNVTGPDAIVDWVIVELRDAVTPQSNLGGIQKSRVALLQRDGDVVDLDGVSPISISASGLDYFIALLHRNHLPSMSGNFQFFGAGTATIDFSATSQGLYNNMDSRNSMNGIMVQAQGDVVGEGLMKYTGAANDRDPILVAIGGNVPTATLQNVYRSEDINMDGLVKYTGAANDRDPILVNIGGNVPTTVRVAQLP